MALLRVKARWTVPGAGTAFSVFHFGDGGDGVATNTEGTAAVNATRTFFDAFKAYLPNQVKINVNSDVEAIDSETGELMYIVSGGAPLEVAGGAAAADAWAAPAGACVSWSTNGIRNLTGKPRRVRGRTFIVPISRIAYANDGTLDAAFLTSLNTAANNLRSPLAGYNLGIYGRPGEDTTANPGIFHSVTGSRITDQVAILRSRRN